MLSQYFSLLVAVIGLIISLLSFSPNLTKRKRENIIAAFVCLILSLLFIRAILIFTYEAEIYILLSPYIIFFGYVFVCFKSFNKNANSTEKIVFILFFVLTISVMFVALLWTNPLLINNKAISTFIEELSDCSYPLEMYTYLLSNISETYSVLLKTVVMIFNVSTCFTGFKYYLTYVFGSDQFYRPQDNQSDHFKSMVRFFIACLFLNFGGLKIISNYLSSFL